MGEDSRKRPPDDLSLLSDMRLDRLLGERWLPRNCRRCYRQPRRPKFPRADPRCVGGITPPLGLAAARYTAKARGKAGVIRRAGPKTDITDFQRMAERGVAP